MSNALNAQNLSTNVDMKTHFNVTFWKNKGVSNKWQRQTIETKQEECTIQNYLYSNKCRCPVLLKSH